MSDVVKVAGIGFLSVALCVAIITVPDEPQIWGALLAMIGSLLGLPSLIRLATRSLNGGKK